MGADDRAIVVGIARYPNLGDLGGPENDARAFAEWLTAADGGQVPADRVTRILSSDFAPVAEPTADAIDAGFEQIIDAALANGARGGRRLYLFFAGHGFAPNVDESALLTANAARRRAGHHIPGRAYANWFRTAALFDEVVLLMDCCREVRTSAPMRPPPWDVQIGPRPSRILLGFATDLSLAARERPSPNDGNRIRGRFTEAVISALRHATDADGRVTSRSLQAFVFNLLTKESAEAGETELDRQEPKFQLDGDIVFAELGAPYRLTVSFQAGETPTLLLGDLVTPVRAISQTATTVTWDVKPGLYQVRTATKSKILTLLEQGGTVHVEL